MRNGLTIIISVVLLATGLRAQLNADSVFRSLHARFSDDSVRLNELSGLVEKLDDPDDWKVLNDSLLVQSWRLSKKKNVPHRIFFQYLYSNALNNCGLFQRLKGRTDSALFYYRFAEAEMRKTTRRDQLGSILNNIAFVHSKKGNYKAALEYYFKALHTFSSLKDEKNVSHMKNNIGFIYFEEKEFDIAYKYFKEAADILKKLGDTKTYCRSVMNYSGVLKEKGEREQALKNIYELVPIAQELKDEPLLSYVYFNLASLWFDSGRLDSSLKFYNLSLALRKKVNNTPGIISCETRIGNICRIQNNYAKAEKLLLNAFGRAVATGYINEQREAAQALWRLYDSKKQYRPALKYYQYYVMINDSMVNQKDKKEGLRKAFQFEYEKQSSADSVKHREEQKVKDARLLAQTAKLKQERTQFWFLITGLGFVAAGLIFVWSRFRVTSKQKKVIENQKLEVDHAYQELHEKNKEVMDSIHYARRIQRALITNEEYIRKHLKRLRR